MNTALKGFLENQKNTLASLKVQAIDRAVSENYNNNVLAKIGAMEAEYTQKVNEATSRHNAEINTMNDAFATKKQSLINSEKDQVSAITSIEYEKAIAALNALIGGEGSDE
jgi:hypothetical protein